MAYKKFFFLSVFSVLFLFHLFSQTHVYADTFCTDSSDSLTWIDETTLSLGNDWELTADKIGQCLKKDDSQIKSLIIAKGKVRISKKDKSPILSVDLSSMRIDEITEPAVTIEKDFSGKVINVSPSYFGLGTRLNASGIKKIKGSSETSEITLINDFPWRFYPERNSSNLVLYPGFFRPVLTGLSDGTFGWTGSITSALEHEFEDGSLNLPVPFTVDEKSVSSVSGQEPCLIFNIGSWFGKFFGLPLESVQVVLSHEEGESRAKLKFDVSDILGSVASELLGVFSHIDTMRKVFSSLNSSDKLKLATKKAIVFGDDKIVKYSSSKLSPLLDSQKKEFLADIEKSKSSEPEDTTKLFKALGRFIAMLDNSEIDYDFISQDIALNPFFVQIGLFEAMGDFQGEIYAALSKRGNPAYYFLDTLGLDITMPHELTEASAVPFFLLEKIPLPENPFQVGLGIVELGGKISGMADPLYDIFKIFGKGGEVVDYSKWDIDAETEGKVALVDSLQLIEGTQEIGLPWPLSLKTTFDFKLGNQNGIAGSGKVSIFDLITGNGAFHFFIGNNSKPVDFQVGLDADIFGVDASGTLNGFFDRSKDFHMKMNTEISYKIAGHKLGGLPYEFDFILDEDKITLESKFSWGSHFCIRSHCLVHSGSKNVTKYIHFNNNGVFIDESDTMFGNGLYESSNSLAEHSVSVSNGTERLVISAESSSQYPVFKVVYPDSSGYSMSDGTTLVIDSSHEELEILSVENQSGYVKHSEGFIIDGENRKALFIAENPAPGIYKIIPDAQFINDITVSADEVPEMTVLSQSGQSGLEYDVEESSNDVISVSFKSSNTKPGSTVGIYARPSLFRNSAYDYWHEEYFKGKAPLTAGRNFKDSGDFSYNSSWEFNTGVETLGSLETSSHLLDQVVTPEIDVAMLAPHHTIQERILVQRNNTSIKIGEITIDTDGIHQPEVAAGNHILPPGEYDILVKFEDRNDSGYIELPYSIDIYSRDRVIPDIEITSVTESDDGKAVIRWQGASASQIDRVRVFVHDLSKGDNENVYSSYFDFDSGDEIKIPGLKKNSTYSFSLSAIKKTAETDELKRTYMLDLAGPRSRGYSFTPSSEAFEGSPCIKTVDCESFAEFENDGDLFIRLRILNESSAPMEDSSVKIYYGSRKEENLIAEFNTSLGAESFSDIHLNIPMEHIYVLDRGDDAKAYLIYQIDTDGQDEHITYDNSGIIEIRNKSSFFNARDNVSGDVLVLCLKKGWNLVGDSVRGDDIFYKFPVSEIYSYNGTEMLENVKNREANRGYFVYLEKDANIILEGVCQKPDFEGVQDKKWNLMGTGVDLYNSFYLSEMEKQQNFVTYTPGKECSKVFTVETDNENGIKWIENLDKIKAGSGFWCVKEQ